MGEQNVPPFLTLPSHRQADDVLISVCSNTDTEFTQISVVDPVLYIAMYDIGNAPSEVDDLHWAFIVGPSEEKSDSEGLLYNMEPRETLHYNPTFVSEWRWLYNQPTVPLRGQHDLLARLMIAEVIDMNMLQDIILRWGAGVSMRDHVEWMSEKWVKNILKSLDEEESCLGRRMDNFEGVEAKVRAFRSDCFLLEDADAPDPRTTSGSRTVFLRSDPPHLLNLSRKERLTLESL